MKDFTDDQAKWMAAFLDGEGCITICKQEIRKNRNPTFGLFVTVTNTHLPSLQRYRDWTGIGVISPKPRGKANWCISGYYESVKLSHS